MLQLDENEVSDVCAVHTFVGWVTIKHETKKHIPKYQVRVALLQVDEKNSSEDSFRTLFKKLLLR